MLTRWYKKLEVALVLKRIGAFFFVALCGMGYAVALKPS